MKATLPTTPCDADWHHDRTVNDPMPMPINPPKIKERRLTAVPPSRTPTEVIAARATSYNLSSEDISRCRAIARDSDRESILDIARAVAEHTGIPVSAIQGYGRTRPVVQSRWLVCYIAHVEQGHTLQAIGRVLRKHHTSILLGVQMERKRRSAT